MKLPHGMRAFRYPAFRRFYAGQTVSIIGSWVQSIALSWLVYRLTGAATLLGLTAFLTQAPILLLGPVAGSLLDRFDRRRLLLMAQWALAAQATLLGAIALLGMAAVPGLLALAAAQGVIASLETSARQSFLNVLVPDREDLPNAIALNSFLMNSGRLIGPGIAGLLLNHTSEGICFLVNAASFLAAIAAIASTPGQGPRPVPDGHRRDGILAGISHARSQPIPRTLLPVVLGVSFFASPYAAIMPALVRGSFGGNAGTLGMLVGAAGLGGLLGTATLANWRRLPDLPRLTLFSCALAGASLIGVSLSPGPWIAAAFMPGVGFGIIASAASVNVLLQATTEERMRGRMISLYLAGFLGVSPFGALAAGLLADAVGPVATLATGGAVCLGLALLLARRIGALSRRVAEALHG
jgi:MFS family permease